MKSIRLPIEFLNYNDCWQNLCFRNGKKEKVINLSEVFEDDCWDEKLETFQSPLYELGNELAKHANEWGTIDLDMVEFYGDEEDVDFKWWGELYEYQKFLNVRKSLHFGNPHPRDRKIIRLDSPITTIDNYDHLCRDLSYKYDLYINNYYEEVSIYGIEKATNNHIFYRAPKENIAPVDGKIVELTQAPFDRNGIKVENFWGQTIHLHVDAVTYVHEINLECYEQNYKGSRIALVGRIPQELSDIKKWQFILREGIPYVDVWESPEFVIVKLKQAGWGD